MFCNKCGSEIKEGAKFCNKCGAPVKTGQEPLVKETGRKEEKAFQNTEIVNSKPEAKKNNALSIVLGILIGILVIGILLVGAIYVKNSLDLKELKAAKELDRGDFDEDEDEDEDLDEDDAEDESEDRDSEDEELTAEPTATPTPEPTATPTPEPVHYDALDNLDMDSEINSISEMVRSYKSNVSHYKIENTSNAIYYYVPESRGVVIIESKNGGVDGNLVRTFYGAAAYYVEENDGTYVNEYYYYDGHLFACCYEGIWHFYGDTGWDTYDEKGELLSEERDILMKYF